MTLLSFFFHEDFDFLKFSPACTFKSNSAQLCAVYRTPQVGRLRQQLIQGMREFWQSVCVTAQIYAAEN